MVTKYKHREITSFEECATNIQRLLVDFFSNLVTPEYFEKREVEEKKGFDYFDNLLKKDAIVAKIILFLSTDRNPLYSEVSKVLKNYQQVLLKIPEILYQYFDLDCEAIKEKFDTLKNINFEFLFCQSVHNSTSVSVEARDFFEYLEEQTSILTTILEQIRDFFMIFYLIRKKLLTISSKSDIPIDDYEMTGHIQNLEYYSLKLEKKIHESNASKNLKNTYDSLLKIIYNDVITFKSLLLTYRSILQLDMISSTSNMILAIKSLETSSKKFTKLNKFRIYKFFWEFYFDNYHKFHLIFSTFLDKKQVNLLTESNNKIDSNVKICEEIFKRRSNIYVEKFMEKLASWNIEAIYFVLGLEKKKFFESNILEDKNFIVKSQYKNNKIFLESNDEIAIVKILYQNSNETSKTILNDLDSVDKKSFHGKHKYNNNVYLFITNLCFFSFLAIKIKEKSNLDVNNVLELTEYFKSKFLNSHIFKKL